MRIEKRTKGKNRKILETVMIPCQNLNLIDAIYFDFITLSSVHKLILHLYLLKDFNNENLIDSILHSLNFNFKFHWD